MTESLPSLAGLPMTRPAGCPFDPPEELARLREERPLSRMVFPDRHEGWLATSHELVRAILADTRFSSRYELLHSPLPGEAAMERTPPAPPGLFIGMDAPDHTRYRSLLTGKFTVRRMQRLTARIEQVTAEHLDAMERQGPPTDLVAAFANPIPALLICELLGAPYEDRGFFQSHVTKVNELDATPEEKHGAFGVLQEYVEHLVLDKRTKPTDDMLSDIAVGDLTDEELTNIGVMLLGGGFDTTANMLGLGIFALLSRPSQFAALLADPDLADRAVEELLRYLSVTHTGMRTALETVELGGQVIKAGECVAVSVQAANRDPEKFPDPDVLDLHRQAAGHVSFGHGVHQCLGQQLARVEMRVAFPALVNRFPTLRLAVPPEEVPLRTDADIFGVHRLPVTWEV
ncbi:cytochrome P450 [Streptomyces sp. NPDC056669]|uniref:cytochrome P450 n=1 Tax=Streptomyces sp. NPDC056669 TaxID=3345903 RepID=UPI0036B25F20